MTMEFYTFGRREPFRSSDLVAIRLPLLSGVDARYSENNFPVADMDTPELLCHFLIAVYAILCGGRIFGVFWDELMRGVCPLRVDVCLPVGERESFFAKLRREGNIKVTPRSAAEYAVQGTGDEIILHFAEATTGTGFSCGAFAWPPSAELSIKPGEKIFVGRTGETPAYFFLDTL